MPDFQFICPFCETTLDCPEELDGKETECPICNNVIVTVNPDNEKTVACFKNNCAKIESNTKSAKKNILSIIKFLEKNLYLQL